MRHLSLSALRCVRPAQPIRGPLTAAAFVAFSTLGLAQRFNIDIGPTPEPIPPFPGAAGQPGHWNGITTAEADGGVFLVNIASTLTPVLFSVDAVAGGDFVFDSCIPPDDFALLMEDVQDVGPAGGIVIYTFTGLLPGTYELYTYAWAPDDVTFISAVDSTCGSDATELVGGPWCGGVFVRGVTHAQHRARIDPGEDLAVEIETVVGFGSVNGFQLVLRDPVGLPFCFGDGTGEDCPCANDGDAGHGCNNSDDTGGGLLEAFGLADVTADSLVLVASSLTEPTPCLFFQGTLALDPDGDGDFGQPFQDGLRCAGGSVIRLGTKVAICGVASYPGLGDDLISDKGDIPAGGGPYVYQVWYRDTDDLFCPPGASNLTNAIEIDWLP